MSLNDAAVIFMGGYVVVMILAGLVMALRPGSGIGGIEVPESEDRIRLRQAEGVMPRRAWDYRPPVRHSHYDPAPWQRRPPRSTVDSLDNVDRATDIKRELGSEHPPWDRLDRQGI